MGEIPWLLPSIRTLRDRVSECVCVCVCVCVCERERERERESERKREIVYTVCSITNVSFFFSILD